MSTGAIIMMLIGCIGLWGGCALAITIAFKHSKKRQNENDTKEYALFQLGAGSDDSVSSLEIKTPV